MSDNKLKEIVAKLKSKEQATPEPQAPKPNVEVATEPQAPTPPTAPEPQAPVQDPAKIKEQIITERINELQNDGVFRLNLLIELSNLNDNLTTQNAILMKIGDIDNADEGSEKHTK